MDKKREEQLTEAIARITGIVQRLELDERQAHSLKHVFSLLWDRQDLQGDPKCDEFECYC